MSFRIASRKGFTLIELLIVVAIIGILAAIAIPNFLQAQVRAKVARVQADLQGVATAFEVYMTDNNVYPWRQSAAYPNTMQLWETFPYQPYVALLSQITGLTTPVEYYTAQIMDPFQDGSEEMSGWPPFRPDGSYILDRQQNNFKIIFPDRPNIKWGIWSIGPDHTALETYAGPWYYLHYDPTNGTISLGNIWRMAP